MSRFCRKEPLKSWVYGDGEGFCIILFLLGVCWLCGAVYLVAWQRRLAGTFGWSSSAFLPLDHGEAALTRSLPGLPGSRHVETGQEMAR